MSDLGDIGAFLREPLADLDWLEVDEEEYRLYETLPQQSHNSIPELVDQWKYRKEQDSFRLSPVNVEPAYRNTPFSMEIPQPSRIVTEDQKEKILELYRRYLAKGMSIKKAKSALRSRVPKEWLASVSSELDYVTKKEAGLLGNLYVDSSMYPKCYSGKGNKIASTVSYVLAKDDCQGCTFNQEGRCAALKRKLAFSPEDMFTEDVWESYQGSFVGKDLSPFQQLPVQRRLQAAFLSKEAPLQKPLDRKPIQIDPLKGVSLQTSMGNLYAGKLASSPENVSHYRLENKIRRYAELLMSGSLDEVLIDRVQTDPELKPLQKHLYVLGHLYLDQSFFINPVEVSDFVDRHALEGKIPFLVGEPSKELREASLDWTHSDIQAVILGRYGLVSFGDALQKKANALKPLADRLKGLDSKQVRRVAQAVYKKPLPVSTRKYASSKGLVRYNPLQGISLQDSWDALKKAQVDLGAVGLKASDYLKGEYGKSLLRVFKDRISLDAFKELYVDNAHKVSGQVKHASDMHQRFAFLFEAALAPEFKAQGVGVPSHKFFESSVGRVLRDLMYEGKTGSSLVEGLRSRVSEAQILDSVPLILAMREEEGLFGKVYVSADAFQDCKEGASQTLPSVSQVVKGSKCIGCVYQRMGSCMIYKRDLVASPEYTEEALLHVLDYDVKKGRISEHYATAIYGEDISVEDRLRIATQKETFQIREYSGLDAQAYYGAATQKEPSPKQVKAFLYEAKRLVDQGYYGKELKTKIAFIAPSGMIRQCRDELKEILAQAKAPDMSETLQAALNAPTGVDLAQEFGMDVVAMGGMEIEVHPEGEAPMDDISLQADWRI